MSTDSAATAYDPYAVEGHATLGNLTTSSGTPTAAYGSAIYGTAGDLVTINAATAAAHGDCGTAVRANSSSVVLNIDSAWSDDTISTNQQTGTTCRTDAI